jgi:hypothetical protein
MRTEDCVERIRKAEVGKNDFAMWSRWRDEEGGRVRSNRA